jgi:hypothetical protein
MKRWGSWIIAGVALIALVALVGWGRTYIPLRTPQGSEAWSRGRLLGVTPVSVPVDIRVAPDDKVCLSWVDLDDRLHIAKLGERGQTIADWRPALGVKVPREPRFLVGPDGEIHLTWLETAEERSILTYAQLNSDGSVQVAPIALSSAGDNAQSLNLAFNRQGEVGVFWTGAAGIYHAVLSAQGDVKSGPVLLVEDGEALDVQLDRRGVFHLAWLQEAEAREKVVTYATLDPEQNGLSQPEEMARIFLRIGQTVESLVVGMDAHTGYVLWVIQDMKYVTSSAQYAFFPLEIPRQKKVRDLELERGGNPLGLWTMRGQHDKLLVAMTETVMSSDGPQLQISILPVQGEQAPGIYAWALTGSHGSRLATPSAMPVPKYGDNLRISGHGSRITDHGSRITGRKSQVSQIDWPDHQIVVTASDYPSLKPSLTVDGQGDLHAAWLETGGFGVYRVAYAGTADGVKTVFNRPTVWDVTDRVLGLAMEFFAAVGLTPVLAVYWSLIPLAWLLVYLLVSGREHLTMPGTWVAFGVAVLLEVVSTYLIVPYRGSLSPLLQRVFPLATAAVGLLVALLCLRKWDEKHLFGAFFVFAIIHGLLQVMGFVLLR